MANNGRHSDRMKKLLGPIACIILIAAVTVVDNASSHVGPSSADWLLWTLVGLTWGFLLVVAGFALAVALRWIARRTKPPRPTV